MTGNLKKLEAYYSQRNNTSDIQNYVQWLYRQYLQRSKAIVDATVAAAALGSILVSDKIDLDTIDPQQLEAFELAFPGKSISELSDFGLDQLEGITSAWKGKYFEILVRDNLNEGQWVGDIHLSTGQQALLADSPIQEGWDLQILNSDGTLDQALQLKATDSLGYIKETLEKYPDIDIIATSEVANGLDGVLNSGMNDAYLGHTITSPIEDILDSPLENLGELFIPGLPFLLIGTREGRKVVLGNHTLGQGVTRMFKESAKTGAAMGAGWLIGMINPLLGVAGTFATRYALKERDFSKAVIIAYEVERQKLIPLLAKYSKSNP